MQDRSTCHTAKSTIAFLKNLEINVFDFVPKSPDLNIIENLWSVIK